MSEKFKQLTKSVNRASFTTSVIYGLSFGVFLCGLLLFIGKLTTNVFLETWSWLIGLAAGGLVSGVSYLLLKKSDKTIARDLDEQHHLLEKVQTMVAFEKEDGILVQLQREQTEAALESLPKPPAWTTRSWIQLAALGLAAVMLTVGLLIPAKQAYTPPYIPPADSEQKFELTNWGRNSMQALIEDVRTSQMQEDVKEKTVTELTTLLAELEITEYRVDMESLVIGTIVKVDQWVEEANTYKELCISLDKSENTQVRQTAIVLAALSVYDLELLLTETLLPKFNLEDLSAQLETYVPEVYLRLLESQIPEEDALFLAIGNFADSFMPLVEEMKTVEYSKEEKTQKLQEIFANAPNVLGEAMELQAENRSIRNHVKNKLVEIFDIDLNKLPELAGDSEPILGMDKGEGGNEDGDQGGGGGLGDGEDKYGGNDIIYDPEVGYTEYGNVFDKYYQKVEQMFLDGNLSEEAKQMISDYFAKLSNGAKQDPSQGEEE